jgi:threonine/homoserine/homoserine lactone efflux protein
MSLPLLLAMAAFALVSSISPGPVNFISLSAAVNFGWRVALRHVWGATVGFTLLLIFLGLSVHQVLRYLPKLSVLLQGAGVLFLLYMAYGMASSRAKLQSGQSTGAPTFLSGALLQWLNPKAWIASISGMTAFTADGASQTVWWFAAIYFVICFLSLACWALAGVFLSSYLQQARYLRAFNLSMAALLLASAIYLLMH